MKKFISRLSLSLPFLLIILVFPDCLWSQTGELKYRNVKEVQSFLHSFQKEHSSTVVLHKIAVSPDGNDITILEIGSGLKQAPAIFVGANFEGNNPLATEGALFLAKMLRDSVAGSTPVKWFILPQPNPDAATGFFSEIKWERTVNGMEVNNDMDDQTNEDGPDDLNGDGLITLMRVEDPEGNFMVSGKDPRLMVKADPQKGERGKYKVYTEGLDNDGDGSYNEDGPGGVNVGINFPHLFNFRDKESGLWPGQAPETYGIMKFIFDHPEIVMVFTLGSSDFCMNPPRSNRNGGANLENIKVPARWAGRFGADPEKTYTMSQIMEMVKATLPAGGREISQEMVAGMLGLGAAVNPLEEDMKFYTIFSEQYKEYLKNKGFPINRMAAPPDKDGSFELWAYYQLGVPSFSMNLFTPPQPPSLKGEENNHPGGKSERPQPGSVRNINQVPGKTDPEENNIFLLSYIDNTLKGNGFVNWKTFTHPTLGKCEIGGFAPFVASIPPASQIDSLCSAELPWLLRLSSRIPKIQLMSEKITDLGSGVYKLELFIENKGILPYPIAMGSRNKQPAPVIITLEGRNLEFLEGYKRTPLGDIGGNQVKKLTWIIKAEKNSELGVKMESVPFGTFIKQIRIGG